jgi:hypothetical protein
MIGETQLHLGSDLKCRYRKRAYAYVSRLLRRTHALCGDELVALLDAAMTH